MVRSSLVSALSLTLLLAGPAAVAEETCAPATGEILKSSVQAFSLKDGQLSDSSGQPVGGVFTAIKPTRLNAPIRHHLEYANTTGEFFVRRRVRMTPLAVFPAAQGLVAPSELGSGPVATYPNLGPSFLCGVASMPLHLVRSAGSSGTTDELGAREAGLEFTLDAATGSVLARPGSPYRTYLSLARNASPLAAAGDDTLDLEVSTAIASLGLELEVETTDDEGLSIHLVTVVAKRDASTGEFAGEVVKAVELARYPNQLSIGRALHTVQDSFAKSLPSVVGAAVAAATAPLEKKLEDQGARIGTLEQKLEAMAKDVALLHHSYGEVAQGADALLVKVDDLTRWATAADARLELVTGLVDKVERRADLLYQHGRVFGAGTLSAVTQTRATAEAFLRDLHRLGFSSPLDALDAANSYFQIGFEADETKLLRQLEASYQARLDALTAKLAIAEAALAVALESGASARELDRLRGQVAYWRQRIAEHKSGG